MLSPRWRGEQIETTALVETYWERGLTLPGIAQKLSVGLRTVHRRIIEAGLPRRRLGHGQLTVTRCSGRPKS
jgi:hypothetical protein